MFAAGNCSRRRDEGMAGSGFNPGAPWLGDFNRVFRAIQDHLQELRAIYDEQQKQLALVVPGVARLQGAGDAGAEVVAGREEAEQVAAIEAGEHKQTEEVKEVKEAESVAPPQVPAQLVVVAVRTGLPQLGRQAEDATDVELAVGKTEEAAAAGGKRKREGDLELDESEDGEKGVPAVAKSGKRKAVSFRKEGEGVDSGSDPEVDVNGGRNKGSDLGGGPYSRLQRRVKKTRSVGGDGDDVVVVVAGAGAGAGVEREQDTDTDRGVAARGGVGKNEAGAAAAAAAGPGNVGGDSASASESDSFTSTKRGRIVTADLRSAADKGILGKHQPDLDVLTSVAAAIEADDNVAAEDPMRVEAGEERVLSILTQEDGDLTEEALLIKSLSTRKEGRVEAIPSAEVVARVYADFVKALAPALPEGFVGGEEMGRYCESDGGPAALAFRVASFIKMQQNVIDKEREANRVLEASLEKVQDDKERWRQDKERLSAHLGSIATTVEEGSATCSYCQSILSKLSEESFQDAFKAEEGQVVPYNHLQGEEEVARAASSSSSDVPVSASRKVVTLSDDDKEEGSEPQLSNGKDGSASSSGDILPVKRKRRVDEVMEEKPKGYKRRMMKEKDSSEVKQPSATRESSRQSSDKGGEVVRRSRRLSAAAKDYDNDLVEVDIKQVEDVASDEDVDDELPEAKSEEVEVAELERERERERERAREREKERAREQERDREREREREQERERAEDTKERKKALAVKEVAKRVLKAPAKGRSDEVLKKSAGKSRRQEESTEDEKGEEKELIRRLKARNSKKDASFSVDKGKEKEKDKVLPLVRPSSGMTAPASDSEDQGPREEPELELKCGCTSSKFGDTVGLVKVYKSGDFVLFCECKPGCAEAGIALTPAAFERHAGRGSSKKWKNTIWVMMGDDKVPIAKVKALEPYYKKYKVRKNQKVVPTPGAVVPSVSHRDEFVRCCKCQKERRFKRRNKEECKLYHDASLNRKWECANLPDERYARCGEDEEREVRRALKGCTRVRNCPGCADCVCIGCLTCRFSSCSCRTCTEFMANAPSSGNAQGSA